MLYDYIELFDIISLSETKCKKGVPIPNYTCFDLGAEDIQNQKKGNKRLPGTHGLTVYIKDNLATKCKLINDDDFRSNNVIWVNIANNFVIGAVYLPHERSDHHHVDVFDDLISDIGLVQNYDLPILMMGDFNSRTGEQNDINILDHSDILDNYKFPNILNILEKANIPLERKNNDKKSNNNGTKLINMCKNTETCIVNGRIGHDKGIGNFTFNDTSTIDYAICSPDLLPCIIDFKVDIFDPLLSDKHNPICLTLNTKKEIKQPINSTNKNLVSNDNIVRCNWEIEKSGEYEKSFDIDKINSFTEKVFKINPNDITHSTLDCIAKDLKDILLEPAKITGMHKEVKIRANNIRNRKSKPWFNKSCKISMKNYKRCKKTLRRTSNENEKLKLKSLGKEHRKLTRKVRRKYYIDLNSKLKALRTKNPGEYWRILNQGKNKVKTGNISLTNLQQHFTLLSADKKDKKEPLQIPQNQQTNKTLNKPFTIEELCSHIKKLKNNKTPGIDNILNEFIKHCPKELHPAIVRLFNIILESGKVPSEWTVGIIKALYKNKGDIEDANNYRGITLLSCLGKLFTSIINTRLYDYVTKENLLGNEQVGFRPKHSTLDHIFALHVISHYYISQGKRLYCAFVDYSKAFDFIDRSYLWQKLLNSNINGKIFNVIKNMYENAKSHVSANNNLSDPFPCQVGVRQGENLSPLLFAMFLNDFKTFLKTKYTGLKKLSESILTELNTYLKIFCLLYADDTILLAESPVQLLKALDALNIYCNKWELKVNVDKTKIMIFSKGKVTKHKSFKFGADEIEVVYDYIYLGTKFNYNGKFEVAMAKQKLKAEKAKYSLLAKSKQLNLTAETFIDLLEKLVVPVLLYGSEIWGYENPKPLQIMLNHTMRRYLRLHKSTSTCMLIGELGLKEVSEYIENRMLNFWYKIATGEENKISTILYKWTYALYKQNLYKSPWLHQIKRSLDLMGESHLFDNVLNTPGPEWFKCYTKERLNNIYRQKWSSDVANNSTCLSYRIMTQDKQLQKYFKLPRKYMHAICQFKCANSKIPVIMGRYTNKPIDDRSCTLCDSNVLGDEFHYLFQCSKFHDERIIYINRYYFNFPNVPKMISLFNESSNKELLKLAKFIYIIMEEFKN